MRKKLNGFWMNDCKMTFICVYLFLSKIYICTSQMMSGVGCVYFYYQLLLCPNVCLSVCLFWLSVMYVPLSFVMFIWPSFSSVSGHLSLWNSIWYICCQSHTQSLKFVSPVAEILRIDSCCWSAQEDKTTVRDWKFSKMTLRGGNKLKCLFQTLKD